MDSQTRRRPQRPQRFGTGTFRNTSNIINQARMGGLVSVDVANRLDVGGSTVRGTALEIAAQHMVAPADIKERA